METMLSVGLGNAVTAAGLALVAAAVGRLVRRPALTHGLWLLVLIKLLTPPLWTVPVAWPTAEPPAAPAALPEEMSDPVGPWDVAAEETPEGDASAATAPVEHRAEAPPVPAWAWPTLLLGGWAAGSLGWLVVMSLRAVRFRRLLRFADPAPAHVLHRVAALASRLGLPRVPEVWVLPGRLSPMLWPAGRGAALFLPAGLLGRLTAEQLDALLVHELAHLKRRDHWVRLIEALASVLYWWHPVVWWARLELRQAEEQCCDAWVVWALPEARRAYALALVETVEFLSEARDPLPALASGLGHVNDLKRRVTMIMRGRAPRLLGWGGVLALLGLGAVLLPLLPVWAADPPAARQDDRKADRRADSDRARDEIRALEAELVELKARLRDTELKLAEAHKRLEAAAEKKQESTVILKLKTPDGKVQVIELPPGTKILSGPEGQQGPGGPMGGGPPMPGGPPPGMSPMGGGGKGGGFFAPGGMQPPGVGGPMGSGPGGPQPGAQGVGERREELMRRLEELTREVEELQRALRGRSDRTPTPPDPPQPPGQPPRR